MHSITAVIKHFKKNWTEELSETAIAEACREAGMTWAVKRLGLLGNRSRR